MPLRTRPHGLVRAMLFYFICALVLNAGPIAWAFNVDLPSALVHRGPEGSMFGFAVTVHRDRGFNCLGTAMSSVEATTTVKGRTGRPHHGPESQAVQLGSGYNVGPEDREAHKAGSLRITAAAISSRAVSAPRHTHAFVFARADPSSRHVLPIWAGRPPHVARRAGRGADRLRPRCLLLKGSRTLGPSGRGQRRLAGRQSRDRTLPLHVPEGQWGHAPRERHTGTLLFPRGVGRDFLLAFL
ncbi:hypothetical protein HPB49_017902 [Dermacentor silvarum]|uniref:Uncharacterized protein n=1 Tax=Dermacentor silvarum TaxID=543639 RepID=A0ACB8DEN5_DERSI|nr:hypothetical protein HPB49_017902 [Dermacentor silvarum]